MAKKIEIEKVIQSLSDKIISEINKFYNSSEYRVESSFPISDFSERNSAINAYEEACNDISDKVEKICTSFIKKINKK